MTEFIPLNLPQYRLELRQTERGIEVFDPIRLKWVILTPEEWVRQHFCKFLIENKGYTSGLMANEISLKLNGTTRRCDTVIYSSSLQPKMIIEYKAPKVTITREVFEQIGRYNLVLDVDYLVVSNGLTHFCCKLDRSSGKYRFTQEIPVYSEII